LLSNRLLVLELVADGVIRVLVVPRESFWTLPVRGGLFVVMATQYMQVTPRGMTLAIIGTRTKSLNAN
jgi:antiviral helicase SLH1